MTFRARFAFILMLLEFAAPCAAGELSFKDPVPDNLTWHGVTVYGVIDIDYAYLAHGAPLNGALPTGLAYNTILSAKYANKPISSFAQSAVEQSKAGIKLEVRTRLAIAVFAKRYRLRCAPLLGCSVSQGFQDRLVCEAIR